MPIRLFIAILGLLLCAIMAHADKPIAIKDSEALEYVGREVEVRGRVCVCDNQPTGDRIYQFGRRIPQSDVRRIHCDGVPGSRDQRLTMIQGKPSVSPA
jgi:hypothetical protein